MASNMDLLFPQAPMEKFYRKHQIKNPLMKMLLDPINLAGMALGGVGAGLTAKNILHNKRVAAQIADRWMPAEIAEKTILRGRTLGDVKYGPYAINRVTGTEATPHPSYKVAKTKIADPYKEQVAKAEFDLSEAINAKADQFDSDNPIQYTISHHDKERIIKQKQRELGELKLKSSTPATEEGFQALVGELQAAGGEYPKKTKTGHPLYRIMGGQVVKDTGKPMRIMHGTKETYPHPSRESMDKRGNLKGPGHYGTVAPDVSSGYANTTSGMNWKTGKPIEPQIREAFYDMRRPLDIEKTYMASEIPENIRKEIKPRKLADAENSLSMFNRRLRKHREDFNKLVDSITKAEDFINDKLSTYDPLEHKDIASYLNLLPKTSLNRDYGPDFSWIEYAPDRMGESSQNLAHLVRGARHKVKTDAAKKSGFDSIEDLFDDASMYDERNAEMFLDTMEVEADFKLRDALEANDIKTIDSFAKAEYDRIEGLVDKKYADIQFVESRLAEVTKERDELAAVNLAFISGDDIYESVRHTAGGKTKARDVLKREGYDGILHRGGSNAEDLHHLVAVAFDPEQIYRPWVAEREKNLKAPVSIVGLGALLSAGGTARSIRQQSQIAAKESRGNYSRNG